MKIKIIVSLLLTIFSTGLLSCAVDINPEPEISIFDPDNHVIQNKTGLYDTGETLLQNSKTAIFTIINNGKSNLVLSGDVFVELSGIGVENFNVTQQPDNIIKPDKETQFMIEFTPNESKTFLIKVIINSNDPETEHFEFTIKGIGIKPEIYVYDSDSNHLINNVGEFDFGKLRLNDIKAEQFTIKNSGTSTLHLVGNPKVEISGISSNVFSVTTQPADEVAPRGISTFVIQFKSLNLGEFFATVSISNSDFNENPFVFFLKGEFTEPEIEVYDSSFNAIMNQTGVFDFGETTIGESESEEFMIENSGNYILQLREYPTVVIYGDSYGVFSLEQYPDSQIDPGKRSNMVIKFTPSQESSYEAMIIISNNDADENPYKFKIKGSGVKSEIEIKDSNYINMPDNTGTFDFGEVNIAKPLSETFTIKNLGTANLTLTGSPKVQITGADANQFTVTTQPNSPVVPSGSTLFTVKFHPSDKVSYSATISIANNDLDENPYDFTIKGVGVAPDIAVSANNIDIPNSTGIFDFGDMYIGYSSPDITFTIDNLGDFSLVLSGSYNYISISGSNASSFTVNESSINYLISPTNSTTFTINFHPTTIGLKTATISIANNDPDENPFTFTIKGNGVQQSTEINVMQDGVNIENITGSYGFSNTTIGSSSGAVTFSIENIGVLNLQLTGSPIVEISGTNATEFEVNCTSTNSTVTPGNSTTFTIEFKPVSIGRKNAKISIANNDSDENPYKFKITGNFYLKGDINGDGYKDFVLGSPYYVNYPIRGCVYVFFGKQNWSPSLDAANADVRIYGDYDNRYFGESVCLAGDVNDDGFEDILIGDSSADNSGCAFLFLGRTVWQSVEYSSDADTVIHGQHTIDNFGRSVSGAGDVNNDGIDDIIIGADGNENNNYDTGAAYIFYGKKSWFYYAYASYPDVKLIGNDHNDSFGNCVSNAGDINGDGIDDVIVGAYWDDDNGTDSGCAFIFMGRQVWPQSINASVADVKLIGEYYRNEFGYRLSNVGDLNSDGIQDIAVSCNSRSSTYIFFGRQNWNSSINATAADVKIGCKAKCISVVDDLNHDGINEILIGYPFDDSGGNGAGAAFIFFGKQNWLSNVSINNADIKLIGEDAGDYFGWGGASVGDINNDGYCDIVIGAVKDDDGGTDSGSGYIFFGKQNWNTNIDASNTDVKIKGEKEDAWFGFSVTGE